MYKAYPILNFETGKYTNRQPWISPNDAFETLNNAHIKRGILEKRDGYSEFGQIVHTNTSTSVDTLSTSPVMGIFNHYNLSTGTLLACDQDRLNKYDTTTDAFVDLTRNKIRFVGTTGQDGSASVGYILEGVTSGAYGQVESNVSDYGDVADDDARGTVVFVNGSVSGTFQSGENLTTTSIAFTSGGTYEVQVGDTVEGATSGATADVAKIDLSSGTWAGGDAAGTFHLVSQSGTFQSENLDVGANLNVATIGGDSTVVLIGDSQGANSDDEFTGDNTDFFWNANWKNVTYITNNQDPIQKYDGNLSRLTIDIDVDGGPDNDVNSCRLIFIVKERIVIFNTNEKGTDYAQRGRWCTIKDPQSWPSQSFIDAPTDDVIVSGGFIDDELYIWFERSVWRFAYTGDSVQPFEWIRIDANSGTPAQMSVTTVNGLQRGIGQTTILGNDSRNVFDIDIKIPDFILETVVNSLPYSNAMVMEESREIYMSYTSTSAVANGDGNIYPDSVLVYNYEEDTWSTYSIPVHTMGLSFLEDSITWETSLTWDEIDFAWNYRSSQSGYPIALMGSQNGKIYRMNNGGSDDGSNIDFEVKSSRWNPYTGNGSEADLGYIDFFVDVNENASFSIALYLNTDTSPYDTKTITCTSVEGSDDKARHRIYVNAIGKSHRIRIYNDGVSNKPRIHEITPYFQTAGGRLVG